MTDPITDMLNQIRNGQAVGKAEVLVPFSRLKQEIARILIAERFLSATKKTAKKEDGVLKLALKYNEKIPAISGLQRISKSGRRVYIKASEIKTIKGGRGIAIISTSKGLMTNKEAKKTKLGGEVICQVW